MVRATTLAQQREPTEIQELGSDDGCTRRQMLWRILLPSAQADPRWSAAQPGHHADLSTW
jgi:ABC-type proline/glycine betaine transport system permease subunit